MRALALVRGAGTRAHGCLTADKDECLNSWVIEGQELGKIWKLESLQDEHGVYTFEYVSGCILSDKHKDATPTN